MSNFDYLISCGDSFTAGMEILGDKDLSEENKAHSYPIHLADLLRIPEVSNTALSGAPNEYIARQTMLDVLKLENKGQDLSRVFVVVGWSSINRLEIHIQTKLDNLKKQGYYFDEHTLESKEIVYFGTNFINPTVEKGLRSEKTGEQFYDFGSKAGVEFANEYLWDDKLEYEKFFANIMLLKGFLESKNIKYIMHMNVHVWNAPADMRIEKYRHMLGNPRLYKFETFTFQEWGNRTYPWERRVEGHFKRPVHMKFAELLHNYIVDNKLDE